MHLSSPTVIIRHQRENLNKCSLRGLERRPDLQFLNYPNGQLPALSGYLLLAIDGPPLTSADQQHGLLLLDATWRYAAVMRRYVDSLVCLECRSIPAGFVTAYPRRQTECPDPEAGLASVEALYIAYHLTGRDPSGLLDNYYWKEEFFLKNKFSA